MSKPEVRYFQSKYNKLSGSSHTEIYGQARKFYNSIISKTHRQPYIRSAFFGSKVFLELFWVHNAQKYRGEQMRRLKYYICAIDLLQHSKIPPSSKPNPNNSKEVYHRFYGLSREGNEFWVQVKEDKRTGSKYMVSIAPPRHKK